MPRKKRASKLLGDGAKANFTEKAKCPSVEGWVKNVRYTQQTVTWQWRRTQYWYRPQPGWPQQHSGHERTETAGLHVGPSTSQQSSQTAKRQTVEGWLPSTRKLLSMGWRLSVQDDMEQFWKQTRSCDGCIPRWMCPVPLQCRLPRDWTGIVFMQFTTVKDLT